MLVDFKAAWFAPSDVTQEIKFKNSSIKYRGIRYRKGVQFVPDFLKEHLPSSATILDKEPEEEILSVDINLQDVDTDRHDHAFEREEAQEHMLTFEAAPAPKKRGRPKKES